jgi:molybdenum cofactor cytidylyltransferase
MTAARATAIVVLAAGEAARYGAAKQLLAVDGQPQVRRIAEAALRVSPRVTVVTGAHRAPVEAALAGLAVDLAFHAEWAAGMGASLAFGVRRALDRDAALDAVAICLCDQPAVGATQLQSLLRASFDAPRRIVAASYGDGVRGGPCLFPARFFDELLALRGAEGARGVLARHAGHVVAVPMPEARIDIDTPDDYHRWRTGSTG